MIIKDIKRITLNTTGHSIPTTMIVKVGSGESYSERLICSLSETTSNKEDKNTNQVFVSVGSLANSTQSLYKGGADDNSDQENNVVTNERLNTRFSSHPQSHGTVSQNTIKLV